MVSSVGGLGTPVLVAAQLKEAAANQDLEIAVIKKGQSIEKAQGEAALKLIDSSSSVVSSGRIDLYA
ncbi:MAG: hypothetical protein Q8R54_05055 [Methylobacter sp.]|nr:hypothetical protein [Methylobacter sp.]